MSPLQKIFDIVVTHAFKQKCRSMVLSGDTCLYRDAKGNMCFVGVLIPDSEYRKDMEERSIDNWWDAIGGSERDMNDGNFDTPKEAFLSMPATLCQYIAEDGEPERTVKFMRRLQGVHDSIPMTVKQEGETELLEHWDKSFSDIAKDCDLEYTRRFELAEC